MELPLQYLNKCLLHSKNHSIALFKHSPSIKHLITQYIGKNNFNFICKSIPVNNNTYICNVFFHKRYPYMILHCLNGLIKVISTATWTLYSTIQLQGTITNMCLHPVYPHFFCVINNEKNYRNHIAVINLFKKQVIQYCAAPKNCVFKKLYISDKGNQLFATVYRNRLKCTHLKKKHSVMIYRYLSGCFKLQRLPIRNVWLNHCIDHLCLNPYRADSLYIATCKNAYLLYIFPNKTCSLSIFHTSSFYITRMVYMQPDILIVFSDNFTQTFRIHNTSICPPKPICQYQINPFQIPAIHPTLDYIMTLKLDGFQVSHVRYLIYNSRQKRSKNQWICNIKATASRFVYHPQYPVAAFFGQIHGENKLFIINLDFLKKKRKEVLVVSKNLVPPCPTTTHPGPVTKTT